jgi:hypothetical protein
LVIIFQNHVRFFSVTYSKYCNVSKHTHYNMIYCFLMIRNVPRGKILYNIYNINNIICRKYNTNLYRGTCFCEEGYIIIMSYPGDFFFYKLYYISVWTGEKCALWMLLNLKTNVFQPWVFHIRLIIVSFRIGNT